MQGNGCTIKQIVWSEWIYGVFKSEQGTQLLCRKVLLPNKISFWMWLSGSCQKLPYWVHWASPGWMLETGLSSCPLCCPLLNGSSLLPSLISFPHLTHLVFHIRKYTPGQGSFDFKSVQCVVILGALGLHSSCQDLVVDAFIFWHDLNGNFNHGSLASI